MAEEEAAFELESTPACAGSDAAKTASAHPAMFKRHAALNRK